MSEKSPTIQEWKKLYEAAIKFKTLESWNWMWDSDIFGVKEPETGQIGYCCIMGANGEHFGLAVYKGSKGLEQLLRILNNEFVPTGIDALHTQSCWMASFEDRKFIDKNDYKIIKKLGLKFRGRNEWPLFRDYTPGYHPWYLNSKEVRFLTIALDQACEMALRVEEDPELLDIGEALILVRVPVTSKGKIEWKDEWFEPEPEPPKVNVRLIDMKRIKKIKKKRNKRGGVWEIGAFYTPQSIREGNGRPYCPISFLIMDHNTGMVMSFGLSKQTDFLSELQERFYKLVEKITIVPQVILVNQEEIFKLFHPITQELEIELIYVEQLDALEEAQTSMLEFMRYTERHK